MSALSTSNLGPQFGPAAGSGKGDLGGERGQHDADGQPEGPERQRRIVAGRGVIQAALYVSDRMLARCGLGANLGF